MSESFSLSSPTAEGVPQEDRNHAEPREAKACEGCKSRKLKCDRQRPSCQRCVRTRASCRYSGRRKPGFPAGQRQLLEAKISRLEAEAKREHVQESARVSGELHIQRIHSPNVDTTIATSQNPISLDSALRSNPESLPIATLEKTRAVIEKDPPTDLVFSLTALFFRHVHAWLPFLDAQRVFADIGSMRNVPLLYFALFGVSIPYSSDSRLDSRSSDAFWTHSKRRIFVDILEEPSLTSLEALTILTLDLSGMTNGPQVWGALSIAVRFSQQLKPFGNRVLRMSAENQVDTALSTAEQTHRRRLFWAIYALDSYITITTGHPSDLSDDQILLFLPTRYVTWGIPQVSNSVSGHLGGGGRLNEEQAFLNAPAAFIFAYQLGLMDISRKVHNVHLRRPSQYTKSDPFDWVQSLLSCSTELFEWFLTLPAFLLLHDKRYKRTAFTALPPSLVMLHAYYHALVIHLHGLAAYPSDEVFHTHMSQQPIESQRRCTNSVESMLGISKLLDKQICEKLGWPFAWSLWVTCRYLLVRNRYERLNELSSIYTLLESLKALSRYWQIGSKYWRLLSQAATESQADPNPSGPLPTSRSTLLAITDLLIPASELEDQARPDPVIYTAAPAEDPNAHVDDMNFNFDLNTQPFNESLSDNVFVIPGSMSENWFGASLFPSCGYQQ